MVIGIRYLTGYAAATNLAADVPEWPPHPGRIFMALAAAHFDSRGGADERAALFWLESQPPPAITASEAQPRSKVESYVPVNDDHGGIDRHSKQIRILQLRTFRKTRPDSDTVFLRWNAAPPESVSTPLRTLCEKVTRIGYSSSLTQVWLVSAETEIPAPNWIPDNLGAARMRIAAKGTLTNLQQSYGQAAMDEYAALEDQFAAASTSARAKIRKKIKEQFPMGAPKPDRPSLSTWHGYSQAKSDTERTPAQGPFDPGFLVLAGHEGSFLGLESTQQLTGALRNAAMKAAGEHPPEWLTGHTPDGHPSKQAHAAFFPLPFVGRQHADGHMIGLGIALPGKLQLSAAGRRELRERLGPLLFGTDGLPRTVKLWSKSGKAEWEWELMRETRQPAPLALRTLTWTGPSVEWASVTPVVLHHYPKKREGHGEQILADALATAQYPEPEWIRILSVSTFHGAGSVDDMPEFTQGGENLCRYHVHAHIRFRELVEGPVLVGRGRYRGYGLFRPYPEEKA